MQKILCLLLSFPYFASALQVSADVDKNRVALNESFVFTIKIQSGGKEPKIHVPSFYHRNDFHLLEHWTGRQNSISIINGQVKRSSFLMRHYRLQPKIKGNLQIKPLTVTVNGKKFQTRPIPIIVTEKSKQPAPSSPPIALPRLFSPPPSLFDIFRREDKEKGQVRLKADVSQTSVYKGEMIRLDLILMQSSTSMNYSFHKAPSFKGFWKEEAQNKNTGANFLGTQVIDQVLYRKRQLVRMWLFPLQTGELAIEPFSIQVHYHGFGLFREEIVSSNSHVIRVKELPPRQQDGSWTGAVGSFEVTAMVREKEVFAHKPVSYIITFKGKGHPRFITLPELKFPASVQAYPPAEKSRFLIRSGQGEKEFEILLVPTKKGTLHIPSFDLTTFDPQKGEYVVHKTAPFFIEVKPGLTEEHSGQVFFEKREKSKKTRSLFEKSKGFFLPSFVNHKNLTWFWPLLFGGLLSGLVLVYIRSFYFKKGISLKQKTQRRLKDIKRFLNKKDWRSACAGMIQLNYFMLYEMQTEASSSDWRQALHRLPPGLSKKYAGRFKNLFEQLEDLSFAPKSHTGENSLNKARELFQTTQSLAKSFISEL